MSDKIKNTCIKRDEKLIELKKDHTNKILKLEYVKLCNNCNKIVERTRNKKKHISIKYYASNRTSKRRISSE